jgi:fibronectin-binding autotransporter adhesin
VKPFLFKQSFSLLTILLAALAVLPTNLHAAGVVTSPTEAGLRAALAGGGTVTFATGGTITLAAVLEITNDTLIDATGYSVTLSGNKVTGVFLVDSNVNFTLKNLTIANGQTNQGAGLCNAGGSVTLSNVTFAFNKAVGTNGASITNQYFADALAGQAAYGGAIYNAGALVAVNSAFLTNSAAGGAGGGDPGEEFGSGGAGGDAMGGGIYSQGSLTLTNCNFVGNAAAGGVGGGGPDYGYTGNGGNGGGGAVYGTGSITTTSCFFILNSVIGGGAGTIFSGQQTAGIAGNSLGGAICSQGGPIMTLNCSVIGNSASSGSAYSTDARGQAEGGGICNVTGMVTIVGTTVSSNQLSGNTAGAGLYHGGGTLLLSLSTLAANSADSDESAIDQSGNGFPSLGGGLYNAATATVTQCMFVSNNVTGGPTNLVSNPPTFGYGGPGKGAGIYNSGSMVLTCCTVAGNTAKGGVGSYEGYGGGNAFGGGVFNGGSQLAVVNCTLANNLSKGGSGYPGPYLPNQGGSGYGGGIYAGTNGPTLLTNCTLSGNLALGGVGTGPGVVTNGVGFGGNLAQSGVLELIETIVNAGVSSNAYGSIIDLGYNISSDSSCAFTGAGSLNNTNPELQPLANNGGPTLTMALSVGSPAIFAGISLPGITTDQRGVARPYGPEPDIGAYEWNGTIVNPTSFNISSIVRSNGVCYLSGVGPTNQAFRLQASSNLVTWSSISTNNSGFFGIYSLQDNSAPAAPVRFYRVVSP